MSLDEFNMYFEEVKQKFGIKRGKTKDPSPFRSEAEAKEWEAYRQRILKKYAAQEQAKARRKKRPTTNKGS